MTQREHTEQTSGYRYLRTHVTDEVAHDRGFDVLALALDKLRAKAQAEYGGEILTSLCTVVLPPDGHARDSDERRLGRWTVALTENPTDFVRRLAGVAGYGLPDA